MEGDVKKVLEVITGEGSSGAIFSNSPKKHRYVLWRTWAPGPRLLYIGLNPSTGNGEKNDPTITRLLGFGEVLGIRRTLCRQSLQCGQCRSRRALD